MTQEQVEWAQQHDWYVACHWHHDGYEVVTRHDTDPKLFCNFYDFKELREWAGY